MAINRLVKMKKKNEESLKDEVGLGQLIRSDIRNSELNFDYDSLDIGVEDKNFLIEYEKNLMFQGKRVREIACVIGETLENARTIFKRYSTEDEPINFAMWYKAMGFNKDQVYLFRGRFKLTLKKPEYKEIILKLSDATIKEAINKKTPEDIVKKVLEGELKTAKEIKEERKKTYEKINNSKSRVLDFENTEIEDAEIVELHKVGKSKEDEENLNILQIRTRVDFISVKLKDLSSEQLKKVDNLLKLLENIVNG